MPTDSMQNAVALRRSRDLKESIDMIDRLVARGGVAGEITMDPNRERQRAYCEGGQFGRVCSSLRDLDEEGLEAWHRALLAWALRRSGQADRKAIARSLGEHTDIEGRRVSEWFKLVGPALDFNRPRLAPDEARRVEALLAQERPPDIDCLEVQLARARLAAWLAERTAPRDRAFCIKVTQNIHDRTTESAEYGHGRSKLLDQCTAEVEAAYFRARAEAAAGEFKTAWKTIHPYINGESSKQPVPAGRYHLAARLGYVQLLRILGSPFQSMQREIDAVRSDVLAPENSGHDVAARAELARHEAALHESSDPSRAIALLEEADKRLSQGLEASRAGGDQPGHQCSYELPRLYLTVAKPKKAKQACITLLGERQLLDVQSGLKAFFGDTNPNNWSDVLKCLESLSNSDRSSLSGQESSNPADDRRIFSHPAKRALLVTSDVIRGAVGDTYAIQWLTRLKNLEPTSKSIRARLVAALVANGCSKDARETAYKVARLKKTLDKEEALRKKADLLKKEALRNKDADLKRKALIKKAALTSHRLNDALVIESGRYWISAGQLEHATMAAEYLRKSEARNSEIAGICIELDVKRRRRDLSKSRDLARAARKLTRDAGCKELHLANHLAADVDAAIAWTEMQIGDPAIGIARSLDALSNRPTDVGAWLCIIRALRLQSRHEAAIELATALASGETRVGSSRLRELVGTDELPKLTARARNAIQNELGWAFLDIDRPTDAREAFTATTTQTWTAYVAAQRGLVASYRHSGDPAEIASIVKRARERFPEASVARRDITLEAARSLIARGDPSAAEHARCVLKDLAENNRSPDACLRVLFALADAYLDAGDCLNVEPLLSAMKSKVVGDSPDDRIAMLEARQLLLRGRPNAAVQCLEDQIQQSESGESLRLALVIARYEARDFKEGLKLLEAGPDKGPKPEHETQCRDKASTDRSAVRIQLEAWLDLAGSEAPVTAGRGLRHVECILSGLDSPEFLSAGELHLLAIFEARGFRQKGAAKHSNDNDRSPVKESTTSLRPAIEYINQARERRPFDVGLMRDQAALLMEFGDLHGAQRRIVQAQRCDDMDARVHLIAGVIEFRLGNIEEAIPYFRRAVGLDSHDHTHFRALAIAQIRLGRHDEAEATVKRGLSKCHPHGKVALRVLEVNLQLRKHRAQRTPRRRMAVHRAAESKLTSGISSFQCRPVNPTVRDDYYLTRASVRRSLGHGEGADADLKMVTDQSRTEDLKASTLDDSALLERLGPALLALLAVLVLAIYVGFDWVHWLKGGQIAPPSPDFSLDSVGIATCFIVLGLAILLPRITGFSWKDASVELGTGSPVQDVVHTDLDLSSSRLLLVSGFSNHRPDPPAEDHGARIYDD